MGGVGLWCETGTPWCTSMGAGEEVRGLPPLRLVERREAPPGQRRSGGGTGDGVGVGGTRWGRPGPRTAPTTTGRVPSPGPVSIPPDTNLPGLPVLESVSFTSPVHLASLPPLSDTLSQLLFRLSLLSDYPCLNVPTPSLVSPSSSPLPPGPYTTLSPTPHVPSPPDPFLRPPSLSS